MGVTEMLICEIVANKPLTPQQQQQAGIALQQKALKVRKARLKVQAAQQKLQKAQQA